MRKSIFESVIPDSCLSARMILMQAQADRNKIYQYGEYQKTFGIHSLQAMWP